MNTSDLEAWHRRFLKQAEWTANTRQYIYKKVNLENSSSILDIGCGTGALISDFTEYPHVRYIGVDMDLPRIRYASSYSGLARAICANGSILPFCDATFDCIICHYLLLWVKDAVNLLIEANRLLQPGGRLLCLAEPDYLGRIEYPQQFAQLADSQLVSLIEQGIVPDTGRRLGSLCSEAGFRVEEIGLSGGQWLSRSSKTDADEWMSIQSDLHESINQAELASLMNLDKFTRAQGTRIQFLPVFYAIAAK